MRVKVSSSKILSQSKPFIIFATSEENTEEQCVCEELLSFHTIGELLLE